ncbi:aminotransferase class V-fold PLP-dependent enzyme [Larsenimonas suaedae]|uniref:cysteine desulfurase n=1 Tax=Larsenimonas suaedae TaxID=1851019 RepID=A0ABU1GY18_9GAMM|nr:cysteine desulfurase [Larsenimonas suaedae]MCM2972845.1 cysteine desulfurase [Larsenimonas suaedae]MDR5896944.1 cysteine desulfurase [Larsenimonas suaedae]
MTMDSTLALDVEEIRAEFPILSRLLHDGKPLIYLDNAATTQTPTPVLEAYSDYFNRYNANIHRGLHSLADEATAAFERARDTVREFLNAERVEEIVFTRGTTEAINLVANTWGRANLRAGDRVVISEMEHHSNIVPWQMLSTELGFTLSVIPVDARGVLDLDAARSLIDERTRLVAVNHVSNALGTINPVSELAALAHAQGALILVDGAQAVAHARVDVQALGADFYAFSGHKIYGPTGIGALYGRLELLEAMPPWQGGGEMISKVTLTEGTTFAAPPHKFEAGTPAIGEAIALDRAIRWLTNLHFELVTEWEQTLLSHTTQRLESIDGLSLIGTAPNKCGVISFVVEGAHSQDIGLLIDQFGVAIRTGHHCAQPLMQKFGLDATCRASFGVYNTLEEADQFVDALGRVIKMLR